MFQDGEEYPFVQLKDLTMQLPYIKKRYLKFFDFKEATLQEIFGEKITRGGYHLKVNELKSFVWMNDPDQEYVRVDLPFSFQLFPIYDFLVDDSCSCRGDQARVGVVGQVASSIRLDPKPFVFAYLSCCEAVAPAFCDDHPRTFDHLH